MKPVCIILALVSSVSIGFGQEDVVRIGSIQ